MTNLVWDETGKRYFEAGLDRGVLYLGPNRLGISWNGLVSIEETIEEDEVSVIFDGIKETLVYPQNNYKAVLTAFTYPDAFLEYQGVYDFEETGLEISGQQALPFGLSYRVLVGNDVDQQNHGYQIHLIYNLVAQINDLDYETYSASTNVVNFSWNISGTPDYINNYKPTNHVVIDTRYIHPDLLRYLEDVLYRGDISTPSVTPADITDYIETGSEISAAEIVEDLSSDVNESHVVPYIMPPLRPRLPKLQKLLNVVSAFKAILLVPNSTLGISTYILGYGDLTATSQEGIYERLPSTRLANTEYDGFYLFIEE